MLHPDDFIQTHGELFRAVQQAGIFDDSKTFVDATPSSPPADIHEAFMKNRNHPDFNLAAFIQRHFTLPDEGEEAAIKDTDSMTEHIAYLWHQLRREPQQSDHPQSTLIALPKPYVVPGGRFREIYYWDSYFTSLGLAVSGHTDLVEDMTNNFAWLIDKVGHIPNGNRVYYVSRSQPPFFSYMAALLAEVKPTVAPRSFLPQLRQEYAFWMDGEEKLRAEGDSYRRLVRQQTHSLNRYFDDYPEPRQESYREDVETAKGHQNPSEMYLHLRAGAESGWDFTSRWLEDGMNLSTIHTTDILPVDLNALLFNLENRLAEWSPDPSEKSQYKKRRNRRQKAVNKFFWNNDKGCYFDYDWKKQQQTSIVSAAALYPLFVGMATQLQADGVAEVVKKELLCDGGLAATNTKTGQQWDYPNGWAPLQWIAVKGLKNYGHHALAHKIGQRWLHLNESVFNETGKMMEKYNVADLTLKAGGGEYPLQDGFGWTNGVALALIDLLDN